MSSASKHGLIPHLLRIMFPKASRTGLAFIIPFMIVAGMSSQAIRMQAFRGEPLDSLVFAAIRRSGTIELMAGGPSQGEAMASSKSNLPRTRIGSLVQEMAPSVLVLLRVEVN